MRKYMLLAVLSAALGGGFLAGYFVGVSTDAEAVPSESVDAVGRSGVLPTTEVTWLMHFSACGHDHVSHDGTAVMGMDERRITERFEHCTVMALNAESALLVSELEGYCPEHYVLADSGGGLTVSRFSVKLMDTEVCMTLDVATDELSDDARTALAAGLAFDSLTEIDMYVEAMET